MDDLASTAKSTVFMAVNVSELNQKNLSRLFAPENLNMAIANTANTLKSKSDPNLTLLIPSKIQDPDKLKNILELIGFAEKIGVVELPPKSYIDIGEQAT